MTGPICCAHRSRRDLARRPWAHFRLFKNTGKPSIERSDNPFIEGWNNLNAGAGLRRRPRSAGLELRFIVISRRRVGDVVILPFLAEGSRVPASAVRRSRPCQSRSSIHAMASLHRSYFTSDQKSGKGTKSNHISDS
jgi:hypothetical protein